MKRIRIAALMVAGLAVFMIAGEAEAKRGKFLGNLACKDCHKEIYAAWEKSLHAKVFELLRPNVRSDKKKEVKLKPEVDYTTDQSCMDCHVTGLDQGGYSFGKDSKQWEGIGCEECHGPSENWILIHDKAGLKHKKRKLKKAGMMKPFKGKTVCLRCHGNRNSPYKERAQNSGRDWTDLKWTDTYHMVPEPPRKQ